MPPGDTPMTQADQAQQFAVALGEIKGLMSGLRDMIAEQNSATNRRMDDFHTANSRRIDDLHTAVVQRINSQDERITRVETTAADALTLAKTATKSIEGLHASSRKTSIVSGTGAGVIVSGVVELVRAILKG